MTSDNVLKFLGNREYLHQVSYQELKSMVVQYPYSLSLRYLLAMKSQQEDNTDLGRNIELLSTYGIDRKHLYKVFSEDPIVLEDLQESVVMGEDFLELKELSTLERVLEETPFIKTENNLQFLEEKLPTSSEQAIFTETIDTTPSLELGIKEKEPIKEDVSIISDEIILEQALPQIENSNIINETLSDEILQENEEEEEYVEMDFESLTEVEEVIGIPSAIQEVVPSESFATKEEDFDKNGLPLDAIEVNDLFEKEVETSNSSLADLFDESEEEAIAEEAVSDSQIFVENPEEVLVKESHTALENITETEITNPIAPKQDIIDEKTQIPFEVSYSETDPNALLEDTFEEETNEIVYPATPLKTFIEEDQKSVILIESESTKKEEIIDSEIREISREGEKSEGVGVEKNKPEEKTKLIPIPATFKFHSLDQFEVALQKNKITQFTKPLPKTKFQSWQEKYSGVGQFSSINRSPIDANGGKVVRRKKKVAQKQFKETVAFAEESLKMGSHIVSETLAQLLVNQGQYSRAKTMYEELSLTIPEKSSFFASEIEKIQNLRDEDS